MAAPKRADSGPSRHVSARARAHPPGCWREHDLCALAGARDVAIVRRDQAQGLAVRLAETLRRAGRPGIPVDPDVLARDLRTARAILTARSDAILKNGGS